MAEPTFNTPELRRNSLDPKGVLKKNLKPLLYLGAALLIIVAAVFSSHGKKASGHASKDAPPQPMVQDNTDSNIQDLKNQLAAEREKAANQALNAPVNNPALGMAAPSPTQTTACIPGQPCYPQPQNGAGQALSSSQQEAEQLASKEREMAFDSRFASNLAYSQTAEQPNPSRGQTAQNAITPTGYQSPQMGNTSNLNSSLIAPRMAREQPPEAKRQPEVNIDSAVGQPYVLYEGTMLDAVLMNRLDGDAPGPVKVLVSDPVYSHDGQHVLIPDGTIVLGEAKKIGATGFGQQRRMAVMFHRMIMPDGYSVDLDQFRGLDQTGAEGTRDKVDNHYLQIFGTSIALGVISGAGEIEGGGWTISAGGSQAFATGASASVSQSATTILDRFMQIPPTITIREGHRMKVYFTQDMLLPGYENHTIPQSF